MRKHITRICFFTIHFPKNLCRHINGCKTHCHFFFTIFIIALYETLPEEIVHLGKRAVHSYCEALGKGEFVNNLIRTMVVGHFGVGKTTLVKGLLQQDTRDTQSTDGIEIHIRKCFFDKETGKWHIQGILYYVDSILYYIHTDKG